MSAPAFASLVDVLRHRAAVEPDRPAFVFLPDGEVEEPPVTYGDLDRQARAIAAALAGRVRPGDRALLVYPPGLEFLAAFFGCLYAGVVAVPAYPPHPARPDRALPRLQAIAADASVAAVLTTPALAAMRGAIAAQAPELATAAWLPTPDLDARAGDGWRPPDLGPSSLAFLQYTSGSTGAPKGVMVTHGNLLHNLACIRACGGNGPDTVSVSWLPVYHDMGLIEGLLEPVFAGYRAYLMPPAAFLQRPARWLEAVSRYRATNSGGPDFAYDLCVRKTTPEQRARLDLGAWRVAYNGSEPVRLDTLEGFARAFAPAGFRRRAFYPVYGLAEATLLVTSGGPAPRALARRLDPEALGGGRAAGAPAGASALAVVRCGPPPAGVRVAVVRPDAAVPCAEDEVGEIWVGGPSVAAGYWNRPEETRRAFGARLAGTGEGPFLRTGDLGFLSGGDLFVTGRLKDVIIVRGRKHYPQDIERTVERSLPAAVPGGTAAFAVPALEGEALVVLAELDLRRREEAASDRGLASAMGAVREAVADGHGIRVHAVALLPPRALPRTSSGKLQRFACRARFLAGTLDPLARWPEPDGPPGSRFSVCLAPRRAAAPPPPRRAGHSPGTGAAGDRGERAA